VSGISNYSKHITMNIILPESLTIFMPKKMLLDRKRARGQGAAVLAWKTLIRGVIRIKAIDIY